MVELVGIDTGGTFTDFILYKNGSYVSYKIPSTPDSPEQAIIKGLEQLGVDSKQAHIVHGTTVATNTLLEGKGAKTAFITNTGLKDLMIIGRQARRELYSLCPQAPRVLIDPKLCFEFEARVSAQGKRLMNWSPSRLQRLVEQIRTVGAESVAICMLFSFLNSDDEKAIEEVLGDEFFVTRSSQIMPEQREYERAMVTWLNSYLGPNTKKYLSDLQSRLNTVVHVMQSDATTLPAESASGQAVRLLLSGPAGGVMAASAIAKACDQPRLLTLDMGGTSTDVSLIDKLPKFTSNAHIAEIPLAISLLDIHTIGAGGGSIARVDAAGGLHVGPSSAGAEPGPACYGQGGREATITDAHVVLGRLPAGHAWSCGLKLDKSAAIKAVARIAGQMQCTLEDAAQGIIDLANAHMVEALRVISIHRGYDPGNFVLFPFGGAGGLHMCAIASKLGIAQILVPYNAGILSAQGMLYAPIGHMSSRSVCKLWGDVSRKEVNAMFRQLQDEAISKLTQAGQIAPRLERWIELRYQGQSSTIRLMWHEKIDAIEHFLSTHQKRYGFNLPQHPVELVTFRVWAYQDIAAPPFERVKKGKPALPVALCTVTTVEGKVPVYQRDCLTRGQSISGPCIILDKSGTLFIDRHWSGSVHPHEHIRLQISTGRP